MSVLTNENRPAQFQVHCSNDGCSDHRCYHPRVLQQEGPNVFLCQSREERWRAPQGRAGQSTAAGAEVTDPTPSTGP